MSRRQLALVAVACLILSSCRSMSTNQASISSAPPQQPPAMVQQYTALAAAAIATNAAAATSIPEPAPSAVMPVGYTEPVAQTVIVDDGCPACLPEALSEQCLLPGRSPPWPSDEYICDGGDREQQVHVARNFDVGGIDPEDTVVHYDTLDGQTRVQASNRVCIYAPRFAAVRQVSGVVLNEQHELLAAVEAPQLPVSQELRLGADAVAQPVQFQGNAGVTPVQAFHDRSFAAGFEDVIPLLGINYELLPYEDLAIIRGGLFEGSEKARLAEATTAAKTWIANEGLEVIVDGKAAFEAVGPVLPGQTIVYDMPKGKPRVRIVKIASKENALPGDIVHFTLRYDNVGDETIGNVTILDNLTPRLEYVPDSAKSTKDADFFATEQDGNALILRWELKEPLKVGDGGTIRFDCKVR
jgi:uncharacterized repeat protein (TIGR01451 family)